MRETPDVREEGDGMMDRLFEGMRCRVAVCALFALGLMACDDGTTVLGEAALQVLLTDAAVAYIGAAEVDIGRVELIGGDDGPVVLSEDGTEGMVDLLDLQGAATVILADTDIEPGTYAQLRLIVEDASVTLAEGYEFVNGSTTTTLTVPSGAQTGIKLNLGAAADDDATPGGLEITPGETVLVIDFDVSRSFVLQGSPETPAGIFGVIFTPTLRVVVNDVAGSISGSVTTDLEGVDVEGMIVTAEPTEESTLEPFQSEAATAMVDPDGNYTIHFLVPGEYTVSVDAGEGFTGVVVDAEVGATVTVEASQDVVGVDFEIVES
jgi:hypothetical protein